jgi:hypothetical protein
MFTIHVALRNLRLACSTPVPGKWLKAPWLNTLTHALLDEGTPTMRYIKPVDVYAPRAAISKQLHSLAGKKRVVLANHLTLLRVPGMLSW